MAVELPAKATAIFNPLGGMSHTEACHTLQSLKHVPSNTASSLIKSLFQQKRIFVFFRGSFPKVPWCCLGSTPRSRTNFLFCTFNICSSTWRFLRAGSARWHGIHATPEQINNQFLQPYTAWQINLRKDKHQKRGKPYMKNLKWKLYPFVLSIKPLTLVLAVNCWDMHVWLPHWSLMQSELIWDTPPTQAGVREFHKMECPGSWLCLQRKQKRMDTRASSWFQRLARITSPQV